MKTASTHASPKRPRADSGERMPPKGRNGLPAYQRIQGVIRKRIDAGQLRPGDAVASERDLAKIHHVSLMTARHALASLEREGIVERRRGIGTFVAGPKIHFNKLMSYTEQMASRSLTAGSKILFAKVIYDEQEIAARLALPTNTGIIKLERLRHASDEPFALETSYPRHSTVSHCSKFLSAITKWNSATQTRKLMRLPPTQEPPNCCPSPAESRSCAFAS